MEVDLEKAALVEFHDAVIDIVTVTTDGRAVVRFEHIVVFLPEGEQAFGVYGAKAELRCENTSALSFLMSEPLGHSETVEAIEVRTADGASVSELSLRKGASEVSVNVIWSGEGRALHFRARRVELLLTECNERLESWSGPLGAGMG